MARARTDDEERYEELKRALVDLPLVRRGSLVRRFMPCGKAGCCCQATRPTLHGPYYQWTRKVRGKTVTVRVSEDEARLLAEWIRNSRRFDKIVGEMERVSFRLTERALHALRQA